MKKYLGVILLISSAPLALGQLDSNSVTVTAMQSMAPQLDQVLFGVMVQSGLNTSLDDVLTVLQGSGITAANFSGVLTLRQVPVPNVARSLQWTFTLTAPLAKIKDTIAVLGGLQKKIAQQNNGLICHSASRVLRCRRNSSNRRSVRLPI